MPLSVIQLNDFFIRFGVTLFFFYSCLTSVNKGFGTVLDYVTQILVFYSFLVIILCTFVH